MRGLVGQRISAAPVRLAYGVDPRRPERYSLRQARYDALAHDIDALADAAAKAGRRLSVCYASTGQTGRLRSWGCICGRLFPY